MSKFKILSIDGGGMRGIIPAKILADLEAELIKRDGPDARLYQYFDLICGTSTGGIIALALSVGVPAEKILALYKEHGNEIFPHDKIFASLRVNKALYDREALREYLSEVFTEAGSSTTMRVMDCKTRVCIPAYEFATGKIRIFKTPHSKQYMRDQHIPLVDVALMTSAAPVYFSHYNCEYCNVGTNLVNKFLQVLDGGLVANNPSLIGLTEAIYCLGQSLKNIEMLSIGTGQPLYSPKPLGKKKLKFWINPLNVFDVMLTTQSEYINNTVNLICHGAGGACRSRFKYVRLQKLLSKDIRLSTTTPSDLSYLYGIGQELYQTNAPCLMDFIQVNVQLYK